MAFVVGVLDETEWLYSYDKPEQNQTGTLETNLTPEELERLQNLTGNIFFGNESFLINVTSLEFEVLEGDFIIKTLTGDFIIKTLTIGREKEVEGFLENAIQMTSYDGDFYKYPELNISGDITYAEFIASERFTNKTECIKFYIGMYPETIEKKYWFDRTKYYYIVGYYCERHLNNITYYPSKLEKENK